MKRPYEKPTLTDLSLPTARAGWLSGTGKASPQALCFTGSSAGTPPFSCGPGTVPGVAGTPCSQGGTPGNICGTGGGG